VKFVFGLSAAEDDGSDDPGSGEQDSGDVAGVSFLDTEEETGDHLTADAAFVSPGVGIEIVVRGISRTEINYLAAGKRVLQSTLSISDEIRSIH